MLSSSSHHTAPTAQNFIQPSGEFSWPDVANNHQPASSEVRHFSPVLVVIVILGWTLYFLRACLSEHQVQGYRQSS